MRLFALTLVTLFLMNACSPSGTDVQDIVAKAYEAHGGKEVWDNLYSLRYEKESKVYNADGSVRVNTLQEHYYEMGPEFKAKVQWQAGEETHEINYTDAGAEKWVNGERVVDMDTEAKAYEAVNAARYTVSQPFKLSDPGVVLTYEGEDTLEEGQKVHVVKASYSTDNENHSKNDEWWYFFDVDTYLCLATMVHHGTTYSYIKNLEYDRSTGLVFNYHRKGYAVDSARNILYHQSEYFYRNYEILNSLAVCSF